MIKASTIIAQLQSVLPTQTDLFSNDDITILSITRSGSTATATTATAHGLTTGNYITILNAKTPITISSITSVADTGITATGATVTVVTAADHDFTEGFGMTAEISGADQSAYNGTFDILTVPNRRTFTYHITSQPASPATGTIILLNNNATGYNGRKQVTVTGTTTFTYSITETPDSPAQGTAILRSGARITGSISWERARDAYTKQSANNLWAFVVLGDISISKSRKDTTDAIQTLAYGDDYRQRLICPFSVYVYIPCVNDIAGRAARDQAEDVRVALYKSLLRVQFDSVLAESNVYVTTATGDRFIEYNTAYYVHEFSFETVCDITLSDTVDAAYNVAFRNIDLSIEDSIDDGDNILLRTSAINLDDVPL